MSIKAKLTVSLLAVVLAFCVVLRSVLQHVVAPSFEALELEEAGQDVDRVVQAIGSEADNLDHLTSTWGIWDDAYHFVEGKNEGFAASNIYDGVHAELAVVLIQVADLDGRVLLDSREPPPGSEAIELTSLPRDRLPANSPLRRTAATEHSLKGIVRTEWGPLVVSAQPVMLNGRVGPVLGTLLMARALDAARIEAYRAETHVEFTLSAVDGASAAPAAEGTGLLRASTPRFTPLGEDVLHAETVVCDVVGTPVLTIAATIPRAITARGASAVRSAWISTFAIGILLLVALAVLLQRIVIGPLGRFTHQALALRPRAELVAGLDLERRDELGQLSRRFAQMLADLEEFQRKLADTSHRAGMSEVATNVLHNVGNMLNSVNVSASLIQDKNRTLPAAQLSKVAALMREKGAELGPWIANDPAGRHLPDVVTALDRIVNETQTALDTECRELTARIGAIGELVRSQQTLAGGAGPVEQVSLAEQVDAALKLLASELKGITVERRFAFDGKVVTERPKLLQVLVNLLKNAAEAFHGVERAEKHIEVAIDVSDACARISVRDNAAGIAREKLATIFQHGFTTKVGGHGFGLHSAANSMTELRGSIRAESEGPGHGACFVLELPLERALAEPGAAQAETHARAA